MIRLGWVLSIAVSVLAHSAGAVSEIRATFRDPVGIRGVCVEQATGSNPNISQVLKERYGIDTDRPRIRGNQPLNAEMKMIVLRLAQKMERLGGRPFPTLRGLSVEYAPRLGDTAQQSNGPVEMGRGMVSNVANYAHEIAHWVGNAKALNSVRNERWYDAYRRAVPQNCHFSHYCKTHYTPARYRNEEFAEVFAAYLTNPELLKRACPASFNFFRTQMFTAQDTTCANGPPVKNIAAPNEKPVDTIIRNQPRENDPDCPPDQKSPRAQAQNIQRFISDAVHVTNQENPTYDQQIYETPSPPSSTNDESGRTDSGLDWSTMGNQAIKTIVPTLPLFMQVMAIKQAEQQSAATQLPLTYQNGAPVYTTAPYTIQSLPSTAPAYVPMNNPPANINSAPPQPTAKPTVVPGN